MGIGGYVCTYRGERDRKTVAKGNPYLSCAEFLQCRQEDNTRT